MKTRKYADVELAGDFGFIGEDLYPQPPIVDIAYFEGSRYRATEPIELSPRWTDVELSVQRLTGDAKYDVVVEGLDKYSMTDELFGAPSVLTSATAADWALLVRADSVEGGATSLGEFPAGYGFYRAVVSSLGDVTVRFSVVGVRR